MRDHITWTALAPSVHTLAPLRESAEYDISLQRRMGMCRIRDVSDRRGEHDNVAEEPCRREVDRCRIQQRGSPA